MRTVLLAAAFALALTATAFAVYQYGLRDVLGSDTTAMVVSGEGETLLEGNVISFAGYSDSDPYKAMLQWQAYERAYLDTHEVPDEWDTAVPAAYLAYGALNREMMDTLDQILEEYGLTLAEGFADAFDSAAQAYALLGSEPFLSGTYKFVTGYAYVSGSFKMENEIILDGDAVSYTLVSNKTYAPMNISDTLPAEDYEEWTYTTASGVTVDISRGQSFAVILADGPDSHTTVTVGRGSEAVEAAYTEDYRQAVEGQVAEGFMTPEGGQIVLEYETMGAGALASDGDEPTEDTDALGVEAYFVYNENFSEPNRLVWRDEAKGLDFTISSNGGLTAQQMLQQAQRLLDDDS